MDEREQEILALARSVPEGFVTTYGDLCPEAPRLAGAVMSSLRRRERPLASRRPRRRLARGRRAPARAARGRGRAVRAAPGSTCAPPGSPSSASPAEQADLRAHALRADQAQRLVARERERRDPAVGFQARLGRASRRPSSGTPDAAT